MVEFRYARGRIPESIQFISEEIREYEQDYYYKTWREYQEDRKVQKLIDRTIENILTALIEVCGTFLIERGEAPENYADAIKTTARILGFSDQEQVDLSSLALSRNRLAHRYLDLKWQTIKDFAGKKELVKKLLLSILDIEADSIQE
jgi:uncharacterized protein YutE (UPF0331/DUF86 family)